MEWQVEVYAHHIKKDGACNVKIRVFDKDEKEFIDRDHHVSEIQIKKESKLKNELVVKDAFVKKQPNVILDDYRIRIIDLSISVKVALPHFCGRVVIAYL